MKNTNEDKRAAMDAVAEVKLQAKAAYTGVKGLVKTAGLGTVVGAAAVYAAHIRQMDRQHGTAPQQPKRDAFGREV